MARLDRDAIINRALDMLDSPVLDAHDRPSSPTIAATAFAIGWLQDGWDLLFSYVPAGGTITTDTGSSLTVGRPTYILPATFVAPVKDGLILTDVNERLVSVEDREIISLPSTRNTWGRPQKYSINYPFFTVRPVPDTSYAYDLAYFGQQTALAGATTPGIGLDLPLVDYLFIRGQEWHRLIPPGSSLEFIIGIGDRMKQSGLTIPALPKEAIPLGRPGKEPLGPAAPVQRSRPPRATIIGGGSNR